ncbi:C4-dicarboxylate-specific signal transduction histidine kinase [Desulfobaculum xiamenense]|uniref:C4-dicarboxylate-specific signal transduction histidine kinase n=1 Tax=Desulfobaculum xiamenense TaxID=995050 RepID=A0A846QMV6_9BACT|nr:HAMP domain-containing histidine kinase [Desulfobaculum xiamenense]NJB67802.1 C4-dicarboxylate-specific signal transduction histidine kinase [Desulfobaculum xiamenense]
MSAENRCSDTGLACFGRVVASASHEFKNHLATIREKAGLLSDLLAMSARGREVDPARLAGLAADIQQRTVEADEAVKRLNSFAHSVDTLLCEVNVDAHVQLAVGLFARLAAQRGVTVDVDATSGVELSTSSFALLQTLFACLDAATAVAGSGATLRVSVAAVGRGARIGFAGTVPQEVPDVAPLLEMLNAELVTGPEVGLELRLSIGA